MIEPHPEFSEYSDARLEQYQAILEEKLRWAKEDGDVMEISWYESEMSLLQAERARRNGGRDNGYHQPIAELKLEQQALHGLAGEIVQGIGPYSESDPAALLLNVL